LHDQAATVALTPTLFTRTRAWAVDYCHPYVHLAQTLQQLQGWLLPMPVLINQSPMQTASHDYVSSWDPGSASCVQEVQQLKQKVQRQEEEVRCANRSDKELQSQLMLQTQTGHAAQKDATKLKVSLYTEHFDSIIHDYPLHMVHDHFLFSPIFMIIFKLQRASFCLLLHAYLHESTVHILMHALPKV